MTSQTLVARPPYSRTAFLALPFKGAWAAREGYRARLSFNGIDIVAYPDFFVICNSESDTTKVTRPKTLYDVKVGDAVWFRDGSVGRVMGVYEKDFCVDRRACNGLYTYGGVSTDYPYFGQVVFPTTDLDTVPKGEEV